MRIAHCLSTVAALLTAATCALPTVGFAEGRYQAALPAQQPVAAATATSIEEQTAAQFAGAQVIARIDNQIVLAAEVLWQVNLILESNRDRIPPEEWEEARTELMKREIARMIDRKVVYAEFRRKLPDEAWPQIEKNLLEPFEEMELPQLMAQFQVDNPRDVERELARLGSSLADVRRAFNERLIFSELVRSKVKVDEEVSHDEMLTYYREHRAEFEHPAQVRWEELMVRKSRFRHPRDAFAEIAKMGNEVWEQASRHKGPLGAVFADVAKRKSDGFTAKDGGRHDWTTQGALKAKTIDEALFTLALGQMSPILESETGFHIVRVLERKEAGRRPFTEVQGEIREKLKEARFNKGVEAYLAQIRKDARVWTVFTGPTTADELLGTRPGGPQRR